jgi:hypothetical protein
VDDRRTTSWVPEKNLDAPVPGRKGSRKSGIKPRKFSPADSGQFFWQCRKGLPTVLQDPVAFVIEDIKMTYETTPGAGGRAACRPGIPGDIGCFHAYSPLPQ